MTDQKIKIGISLRIINAKNYSEKRDGISQDWSKFFEKLNFIPILIPNTLENIESFLDIIGLDGIVLSGGDNIGDDLDRDSTEIKLIQYCIKNDLPIFGVCRGMQMINHFFNGTIQINSSNAHVGTTHKIKILNNFLVKKLNSELITVNSYHNNIIQDENLSKQMKIFTRSVFDNSIEGIFHQKHKILGVMWHPEREQFPLDKLILNYVFNDDSFWDNLV